VGRPGTAAAVASAIEHALRTFERGAQRDDIALLAVAYVP